MTSESKPFQSATRVQISFVTAAEKKALAWLAAHMPTWVGSDHLTTLGFAAQVMVGVSYALARYDRVWLLWGILFLAINWLGDSLDGTLARYRNRQRPRYGFYVDHVIDAVGTTALCLGLALSGLMTPMLAMALLIAFFVVDRGISRYLYNRKVQPRVLSSGPDGASDPVGRRQRSCLHTGALFSRCGTNISSFRYRGSLRRGEHGVDFSFRRGSAHNTAL